MSHDRIMPEDATSYDFQREAYEADMADIRNDDAAVDCSLPTVTISITPELINALFVANVDMELAGKPAILVRAIEKLRESINRQMTVRDKGPSTAGLNQVMANAMAPFLKGFR